MAPEATPKQGEGQYVRANGIDIHYREAGRGEPLVLLNQGMASSSPVWAGHPSAYANGRQSCGLQSSTQRSPQIS